MLRRRVAFVLASAALATTGVALVGVGTAGDALAETFFEKLFGLGSASAPPHAPPSRLGMPARMAPARESLTSDRSADDRGVTRPLHPRPLHEVTERALPDKGQFQTFCVRTCDGYYFPLNRAVSSRSFRADANACRARCGGDAKLYYGPTDSDDKAAMLDLDGHSYGELATAFKYRKTLVSGCSCRPMPWSEAELERHRQYALAEEEAKAGQDDASRPMRLAQGSRYALPPPISGPGVMVMSAADATPVDQDAALATPAESLAQAASEAEAAPPPLAVLNRSPSHRMERPHRLRRIDIASHRHERRQRHAGVRMRSGGGSGILFFGQPKLYPGERR